MGIRQLATSLSVEGLTQLSPEGRAIPKLAESWWWENEGLELHLNLRPGIKFHDGAALTAAVAADTLQEAITRPSNRALYTSFNDIKSVRPIGDREIAFDLTQPSAFLPDDLELPISHGSPLVGTGPYRVVKNDPAGMVLDRFEDYYLGKPNIPRVTIRPFDTLRTAWTSLLRGDVDMVTDVPPDAVSFIQNDDIQVVSFSRRYQYVVAFNSRRSPFNSPVVRRALNMAVDREALIRDVLNGYGVASTGPLWPKHWAYNNSIPSYRFDPTLATSLLKSAGLNPTAMAGRPNARLRFTCLIPENFSVIERLGLAVQKQLYAVGVDMQFEVVSYKDFSERLRDGHFDAMLTEMVSGPTVGRSYLFWRSAHRFPQGLNAFGYENTEAERSFDVLRTSTNDIAIQSAFSRLQQVFLDDPPALFLAWNERSRAIRRDFRIVQDSNSEPADPIYTIWRWQSPGEQRVASAQ